ncbi:MAG: hypothetical protein ACXVW8_18010 [Nocardioidaceae bacterium]
MDRLLALVVLTATFVPAAVLGALPVVLPIVAALTLALRLLGGREPRATTGPE